MRCALPSSSIYDSVQFVGDSESGPQPKIPEASRHYALSIAAKPVGLAAVAGENFRGEADFRAISTGKRAST